MGIALIIIAAIVFCGIDYEGRCSGIIMFLLMFLLMGWRGSSVDIGGYQLMYETAASLSGARVTDIGFGLLMYAANLFHLDYFQFQAVYTFIGLLLLFYVMKQKTAYPALFIAVYFLFSFPTITVQIRSFLAESFQMLGIYYFIQNTDYKKPKLIILFLIAVLLHNISLFFLFAAFLLFFEDRKIIYTVSCAAAVGTPLLLFILRYVPLFIVRDKLQYYFIGRTGISIAALGYVCLYIAVTGFMMYLQSTMTQEEKNNEGKALDRMVLFNVTGLIACALILFFNSNFYRICRVILFVDVTVITGWIVRKKIQLENWCVVASIVLAIMFIVMYLVLPDWKELIESNLLLQQLELL